MGILSFFTKNRETVNDIFDKDDGHLAKMGEWVGNMNFTEEEKSEAQREMIKRANDFVISSMGESSIRSRARREITRLIIGLECLLIGGSGISYFFNPDASLMLFQLATSNVMVTSVPAIILFFFGTNMLRASRLGNDKGK